MPQTKEKQFRNYTQGDTIEIIRDNYRKMRSCQTVEYVRHMHNQYLTFSRPMHIWDALEKLNNFVDLSDPDINLPNVMHLIQAAEGARKDARPDWMQLVCLIHDLGKVMYLWGKNEDGTTLTEQWGLVGDIFLVGCKIPETCVYPEFNQLNPDMQNPQYNTPCGIYQQNCGIDYTLKAWGHDEYLYNVLKNHPQNKIPEQGMIMIRYHSFYPWHTGGSYTHLMNQKDYQYIQWVKDFNQYDLYTKRPETYNLEEIKAYYLPIIKKYLGPEPVNF